METAFSIYTCSTSIITTRSELASLALSFRGHNFARATTYDCAHVRTRMRIHSSPQATPPIDIEGCGLRDQRCWNVHPASFNPRFNQLAKETRYSRGSFARNSSRQKTPTTESPPSVKQSRTISNPERCSFVAFEPPKVSLPVDLHFLPHASNAPSLVSRLTLRLSMSVDNRTSNQTSALKRKEMFLARVEWLPVTSRSHGQTDKCKISIMIILVIVDANILSPKTLQRC